MKPTVHYKARGQIVVGVGASVIPTDHPGNEFDCNPFLMVTNGEPVHTSTVQSYDAETGRFETLNTIYVPVSQ